MTPNQREALELLWQLGTAPAQIARQTGLSLADVCAALSELSGRPDERPVEKQKRFAFDDQPDRSGVSDR